MILPFKDNIDSYFLALVCYFKGNDLNVEIVNSKWLAKQELLHNTNPTKTMR